MSHAKALSAIERQNQIIELLAEHGSVQVDDLVNQLNVSKMTVHRDLDALEADGRLRKVHGGAALAEAAQSNECTFCHGAIPADSRSKVTLHMVDGTQHHACCPHCGLLAVAGNTVVCAGDRFPVRARGECALGDVCGPVLDICCAPTTLAFRRSRCRTVAAGFGGQIKLDASDCGLRESVIAARGCAFNLRREIPISAL
jgi:Fe2+ or Zn2+ uptake regulation protein